MLCTLVHHAVKTSYLTDAARVICIYPGWLLSTCLGRLCPPRDDVMPPGCFTSSRERRSCDSGLMNVTDDDEDEDMLP